MTDHNSPRSQPKVKAYARNAAFCAEAVLAKDSHYPTLNLEVARKPAGRDDYDWNSKLVIQLSKQELPELAALTLGHINNLKFSRNDCGIEIDRQKTGLYLRASRKSVIAMPITRSDCFRLSMLTLSRLEASSLCSTEALLAALAGAFKPAD